MSLTDQYRHLLPVDEILFHEPLYVTSVGWERIMPGEPYPKKESPYYYFDWRDGRTLPEFCVALNIAGRGELETRTHREPIRTGDAFLFRPGEWHRHRPSPKTGWTIMWLVFNGDEPLRWLRDDAFNLRQNIPVIENRHLFRAQFEYLLARVHRNPSTNSSNVSRQAVGLLSHFLLDLPSGAAQGSTKVQDEAVKAAMAYIWNFSHNIMDVSSVADKVGIARRTLDRRFKAATGRSVLEEINFCRVSRAAQLLRETSLPVKHIIHRASFRNAEHLRLAFRKTFGKSPLAYRQQG